MLLLQCKSASCWRKWRKTGDGKCDVHSSHRATASVPEQPTASSPNMKHVWGLICLPLMGCQHSGLRGQQGRRASPLLHQSHWPATDMSNNFLSGCSLLHTHTHTRYLDMYKTWAYPCALTHFYLLEPCWSLASHATISYWRDRGFSRLSHVLPALLDY